MEMTDLKNSQGNQNALCSHLNRMDSIARMHSATISWVLPPLKNAGACAREGSSSAEFFQWVADIFKKF